ncbi:FAD-dependent monooxygenase [Brevibacillus laterosporus]|uniref:FAD-dependent monooxygenase n=1 Tax=Brevibacillus laterosporus TaxID=1465 RepID=UPI003D23C92D
MKTSTKAQIDVVIVGGGPVGLMCACELAQSNIHVIVLERRKERVRHSRALTLHPRTLEIFAMRGILDRFITRGYPLSTAHYAGLETRLDFSRLDTPFAYTLFLPQSITEEILEQRALELGVEIRRQHQLTNLQQTDSQVHLFIENETESYELTANYVIGADGARSLVRTCAEIDFTGSPSTFTAMLGDIILTEPPAERFLQFYNAHGSLLMMLIADGVYRFAMIDPLRYHIPPDVPVTIEELQASIERITNQTMSIQHAGWLSRVGSTHRQAASYRNKRIFLVGDAAHIHFPAGGQGLNVGLQDAVNLCWKLAAVIQEKAPLHLLDTYHVERHQAGAVLLKETLAQVHLLKDFTESGLALRELMSTLLTIPDVNRRFAEQISGINVVYPPLPILSAGSLAGHRCPNVDGSLLTGQREQLFTIMQHGHWVLLICGIGKNESLFAQLQPIMKRFQLECLSVDQFPPFLQIQVAVLIRPDGFIAWNTSDESSLIPNIEKTLTDIMLP